MKAIQTKFLAPSGSTPCRIMAFVGDLNVTVQIHTIQNEAPSDDLWLVRMHFEVVKKLVSKHSLTWNVSQMVYGETAKGRYSFCFPYSIISA